MMTRMDSCTRSKFHPYKANQVFGSGADVVWLPPLQPAQSKTSPPHCSWEAPTHPWGQLTLRLPRHKQTALPSRTRDCWSLERNVQVAISATRTGSTFDLSASGKFLLFSASQLPCSQGFAEPDTRHCRNAESRGAETARQGPNRCNHLRFSEDGYLFILTVFQECWKSDAEKP